MKTAELEVEIIYYTEHAVLCTDGDKQFWIPRSLIHSDDNDDDAFDAAADTESCITLRVALWFATKEGLV